MIIWKFYVKTKNIYLKSDNHFWRFPVYTQKERALPPKKSALPTPSKSAEQKKLLESSFCTEKEPKTGHTGTQRSQSEQSAARSGTARSAL